MKILEKAYRYILFLILSFLITSTFPLYAGSYEVLVSSPIKSMSSPSISLTDVFQPLESSTDDKVDRVYGLRLIYNKKSHKDLSTACRLRIGYVLEGYDASNTMISSYSDYLEVDYKWSASTIDVPLAVNYYPLTPAIPLSANPTGGIRYVKASITSLEYNSTSYSTSGTSTWSSLPIDLVLELFCQNTKYSNLAPDAPSINHRFEDNGLLLYWRNIVGAESYDVEWVHMDYYDEDYADCISGIDNPFSIKTPVRINTSEGYYNLDATYTKGAIFYRYRPVGVFTGNIESDGSTHRRYGSWINTNESSTTSFVVINDGSGSTIDKFENARTWQLVKSYAEEGKNKKVISYYDDTYRNRQSVTNLSTNHTIAVAENKYDYEGRAVLSILPSPVATTDLHYQSDFNQINISGGGFHKEKYDGNSLIPDLDPTTGSAAYYSPNIPAFLNSVNTSYVADAAGYPYSRVEFKRDNTGKPTAQSGVGLFHQIMDDEGKETRYYYSTPSSTKLHRLFGSNVGKASFYKTQLVKDANGQLSLSYMDASNRTIATSLLGESPGNVQVLDDNAAVEITENLSDNNTFDASTNSTRIDFTFFNEIPTTTYDFSYSMGSILNVAGNPCPDCRYELSISLVDENGKAMPFSTAPSTTSVSSSISSITVSNPTLPTLPDLPQIVAVIDPPTSGTPDNCNIFGSTGDAVLGDIPLTFSVVASKVGEYHITKILKILQPDINEDLITYAALGADPAIASLVDMQAAYEDNVDITLCDVTCEQKCTDASGNVDVGCLLDCINGPTTADKLHDLEEKSCETKLNQIRQQVMPGGYFFDLAKTEDFWTVRVQPLLDDWNDQDPDNPLRDVFKDEDGNFVSTLFDPTTTGYPDNVAMMEYLHDPSNWHNSFANALMNAHPEICHYHNCKAFINSRVYDNMMALQQDYAVSHLGIPIDLPASSIGSPYPYTSSSDPASATNMLLNYYANTDNDPINTATRFKINGSGSTGYKFSSYVEHDHTSVTGDYITYAATGGESISQYVYPIITIGHPFYGSALSSTVNNPLYTGIDRSKLKEVSQTHWKLYRGMYKDLKEKFINTYETEHFCPYQTPVSGYDPIFQAYHAEFSTTPPSAADPCSTLCVAYATTWLEHLENNIIYGTDIGFQNSTHRNAVRALLMAYCQSADNCPAMMNGTGMVVGIPNSKLDMISGDANLIDVQDYLTSHGYHSLPEPSSSPYVDLTPGDFCIELTGRWMNKIETDCDNLDVKNPDGTTPSLLPVSPSARDAIEILLTGICERYTNKLDYSFSITPEIAVNDADFLDLEEILHTAGCPSAYQSVIPGEMEAGCPSVNPCFLNILSYLDQQAQVQPLDLIDSDIPITQPYIAECVCMSYTPTGTADLYTDIISYGHSTNGPITETMVINGLDTTYVYSSLDVTIPEDLDDIDIDITPTGTSITCDDQITVATDKSYITIGGRNFIFSDMCGNIIDIDNIARIKNPRYTPISPITPDGSFSPATYFSEVSVDLELISSVSSCDVEYPDAGSRPSTVTTLKAYIFIPDAVNTGNILNDKDCDKGMDAVRQLCIDFLMAEADQLAEDERNHLLEDALSAYMVNYNASCNAPQEKLTMTHQMQEYHYTLYYYDQAGNLVQTVPPEGVHPLSTASGDGHFTSDGAFIASAGDPVHTLLTNYKYNSLNQVIEQTTPDAGLTAFWYNRASQLKLSQNAKQEAKSPNKAYSFTHYDYQGRIIAVGEVDDIITSGTIHSVVTDNEAFLDQFDYPAYACSSGVAISRDVTLTAYDGSAYTDFTDINYRGRVASVTRVNDICALSTDRQVSYYRYDELGNVNAAVQDIGLAEVKRTDYSFDLASGKVTKVSYQRGKEDAFYHEYEYDADNRITNVYTSHDKWGRLWEQDGEYFYYPHGPLARVEIGQDKTQGLDYYYTIHGWLKGINTPSTYLSGVDIKYPDPGQDGRNTALNKYNARDEMSLNLGYYEGDYAPVNASSIDFGNAVELAWDPTSSDILPATGTATKGLYNGNIAWMMTDIAKLGETFPGSECSVALASNSTHRMDYQYDQLNRIKQEVGRRYGGTSSPAWMQNSYESYFNYDKNGNIMHLDRYMPTCLKGCGSSGTDKIQLDDLDYIYERDGSSAGLVPSTYSNSDQLTSNRLRHVTDQIDECINDNDIDNQCTKGEWGWSDDVAMVSPVEQGNACTPPSLLSAPLIGHTYSHIYFMPDDGSTGLVDATWAEYLTYMGTIAAYTNYEYDKIGNLTKDRGEDINQIVWNVYGKIDAIDYSTASGKTDMAFKYDAMGNRVQKIMMIGGGTDPTAWKITYYVRDASGNVMGTYTKEAGTTKIQEIEYPIYGSSRLGTYTASYDASGVRLFENRKGTTAKNYGQYARNIGHKQYELANHLGNVLAVISDRKIGNDGVTLDGVAEYYNADVLAANDYYAFGMLMPGRQYNSGDYRYGFNGKEKDDEVKGSGNSLDFGARIYDSRLGRFNSIDPQSLSYPFMTPFCYAANNPIRLTDENGEGPGDPLRLIFWGGAQHDGDNGSFKAASKNVANEYGGVPSNNIMQVTSARQIVTKINAQKANSIQSVDIFTHGGTNALYVNNGGNRYSGNTSLYRSQSAKLFKSLGGTLISGGSAVIDEIDFSKFTNNAKIELHGCMTADGGSDNDNIAADFSKRLYQAGKLNAVVIGHTTPADPLINGDPPATTDAQQDYRHKERAVFHNGEVLFTTKMKGRIGANIINSYLDKKKTAGDKYDGTKQVYKVPQK